MAKIPETFNMLSNDDLTPEKLLEMLQEMYQTLAKAINSKPTIYLKNTGGTPADGNSSDTFAAVGDININTATPKVEIVTQHNTATTVVWTTI